MAGSKKYIGKLCPYCNRRHSTLGEHVIAREFFPRGHRPSDLPKVPACDVCNTEKSRLEHYATTALSIASMHPVAEGIVADRLDARIAKNHRLARELALGSEPIWIETKAGLLVPSAKAPFRGSAVTDLVAFIIRGLAFHYWGVRFGDDCRVDVLALQLPDLARFRDSFGKVGPDHFIHKVHGEDVVAYSCTMHPQDNFLTLWEIDFYGGLMIGLDNPDGVSKSFLCGFTQQVRDNDRES